MSLLSVSGLCASLGRQQVLRDVSFDLGEGELLGVIGPNGAGKSTLMRALLGLVPAQGEVRIAGKPASTMRASERALQVAYVPQSREIAWDMSVEAVVRLGRGPHRKPFSGAGQQDVAMVEQAMSRMDIDTFRDRPVTALSGGEQARVLIARALAQDTPVLLADEPTAGLDPAHQFRLMRHLVDYAKAGKGAMISLHDLGLAARWCTRLILLEAGRIVADGAAEDVLSRDRLRSVYGVEAHFGSAKGKPLIQPIDLVDKPNRDR